MLPLEGIDAGGMDLDEHLVISRYRPGNRLHAQHVGVAITALHDGAHGMAPSPLPTPADRMIHISW